MLAGILNTNKKRGLLAVIGCLMLDISVGEFNLLAFLYPYFASYFHSLDPEITPKDMAMLPCVWLATQIFSGPLSVLLYNKLGFRPTFAIFVLVFFSGQIIASQIRVFKLFAVVYGIFGGMAQGGLGILPIYCCWRYFPKSYSGIISGTILSAYALAPLGTSVIALNIINPENLPATKQGKYSYFTSEVYSNVPKFMIVFGFFCLTLGLLGCCLVLEPLDESSELNDNSQQSLVVRDHSSKSNKKKEWEIKPIKVKAVKSTLATTEFKTLYMIMLFGLLYPHYFLFNFKQIGLEHLPSPDKYINFVASIGAICNGTARLLIGLIYQRIGARYTSSALILLLLCSSLSFLQLANSHFYFGVGLCLFYASFGGLIGLFPLITHALFKSNGALAYTMVFSASGVSCLFVSLLQNPLTELVGQAAVLPILGTFVLATFPLWGQINAKLLHLAEQASALLQYKSEHPQKYGRKLEESMDTVDEEEDDEDLPDPFIISHR